MRKDGVRVKNISPIDRLMPYVMSKRYDAQNMCNVELLDEPVHAYLNECRKKGLHMSHMAVIIASYLRTVAEYPWLNRFVANKKIYRRNEITVSFVMLTKHENDFNDTVVKIKLDKTDDIFEVNRKINEEIEKNRVAKPDNKTERIMNLLTAMPGLVNFAFGVIKWMDRHNILPKAIIDASPFHTSMFITNLASLRTNYIYHHVYEFGTTSLFLAMGQAQEKVVKKGKDFAVEKVLPIGVVMDERICNGCYYSHCFKTMQKYMKNPKLLELPPEIVNEDND